MNRAIAARLHQLEAALCHQRAARQQREEAATFELPDDPAEVRRLYRELTTPSGEPVPELAGLTPAEMVEAYRRMVRCDPHRGARVALRRVAAMSQEGHERWRRVVGGRRA